ncbi:serine/arginine repetitive matrix protein 2 [Drosophila serrata]|uniref:serine/arginine repetitive matrix protein 2 n=1 Tax=Drosophila serrata TaxID=7274 RepID=UPI000A1D2709|nr:serine/arginine repetitive matrix protein 2 [Drosophila serrata]
MSHSGGAAAAAPEAATGGGASSDLDVDDTAMQPPPPEALQDGDTSNSLEPGEVVTPPHNHLPSSPAFKKQMPLSKTLRKTLNSHSHIQDTDGCEEQVRALYEMSRKENGAEEAPMDEADDSEGLYSDTDSSVEDFKSVEDVQQARKEKQAEAAAAAALPQAPPTPFLGLSPLRFHMRPPPSCFDFPRMGFMPRMGRGGPRGMRPPFFGRPPVQNRMGSSAMMGGQSTVGPGTAPGGAGSQGNNPGRHKRPQSDLSWTTSQPAVSFTFNLIPECSSAKHKECRQKAESTTSAKSKDQPASEEKNATEQSDPLREKTREESHQNISARDKSMDRSKERDENRGKTREKSQPRDLKRGSPERPREKSKDRDLNRGKTRERSKEKEFNRGKIRETSPHKKPRGKSRERDSSKGRTRERSRPRDQDRGKTRENSRERDQTRAKPVSEKTREKERKISQERTKKRGTTRERSREKDRTRMETTDRCRSNEKLIDKFLDRKERHRDISKETGNEKPRDKSTETLDKLDKIMDKSKEKRHEQSREHRSEKSNENPRERSRRNSRERIHDKSPERVQQEQKDNFRDKKESTIEPPKDRLSQKFADRRRERSRDKERERSRDRYSKEKFQEHLKEKPRHTKHDKSRDHSREKESRSRRAPTPHDSFGDASHRRSEASSAWAGKEGTPPMTPPHQRAQTPPASDTPKTKVYDIFADSPPRQQNTAVAAATAVINERSTTPPLKVAPVATPIAPIPARPAKLTPLLKASEIHSRIGALLEDDDNDLHLEALLATKERLFRRTNEYKERKEAPKEIKAEKQVEQRRYVNPFNRESVLSSGRKSYSYQRNGSRCSSESEENWDKDEESLPSRRGDISIKIEKDLTPPPPQRTFGVTRIKVERNATPPRISSDRNRDRDREVLVRNGAVAANAPPPATNEQESPDTDDYIDNWENDDSISSMPKNAAPATPTVPAPATAPNHNAPINITPLPPPAAQFNDDDDEYEDDSNALWNANSTPPPRAKATNLPMSNIHELYDKFMNSIDMGSAEMGEDTSKNSSLSNSTAEDSSSGSDSGSSTSSSSSDSDSSSEEEEDGNENTSGDESPSATGASKSNSEDQPGKEHQQKKNNVSKDLRKLKSLEDNLSRIQMMRENYDAGDEISEELLKMESLFLMQRNAIMDKYRKQELKSNSSEDHQQQQQQQMEAPQMEPQVKQGSPAPVNSIFDANRGAIKMTISRLKLTSKSAIFDKDETDQQPAPNKLSVETHKPTLTLPLPSQKPPKEVAIVKPTIVESRTKPRVLRSPPPPGNRRRSRSRSISRNKSKRRSLRTNSRSPSPKRWRPPSPRRGSRFGKRNSGGSAAGTKMGRSHSRSLTRSRTRSRSPNRRRRPPSSAGSRRRGSLSPGPMKIGGPRSPPHPRLRRSLTRERERERERDRRSRSPLPFKPPSPPMRRSWSHSRSPTRRRTRSRSRSPRFRSPRDGGQSFADYFGENQNMEAAAYYYNMSLMQQEYQDPTGTGYDTYAAYMDSAYNMEQAYAQFTEGYAQMYGDYPGEMDSSISPQLMGSSVLRELPMAPVIPVAVQKGNVLEIVPTGEDMVVQNVSHMPMAAEEPMEDESKPKRKRVNFVDNVLPNYESDSEDRAIVTMAVERALCQHQERRSRAAARLQQIRDELLALPPPPPPLAPKPANLEKPVLVQKKPKFRFFHFDPFKGAIVKTHSRILRPNIRPPFDPKHFAMLIKTGRLPPFPPSFMRHRPPNIPPHVDPATKAAMFKEFFSKHPPPPIQMPMTMPDGMPYYLSGPPPMPAGAALSPVPQPIPVLGSHGYQGYAHPSPVPVPVPVPPVAVPPLAVSVPAPAASTPPPARIAPFFTPPPLPELLPILPDLPTKFTVKSVPTITEIMPVDILQQLGPLPKTLDVDDGGGMGSPELDSNDLKEIDAEAELEAGNNIGEQQSGIGEAKTQLLMETQ